MAHSRDVVAQEDDVDDFEYLLEDSRPGFAEFIEWLFGSTFYLLLLFVSPWRWFRRERSLDLPATDEEEIGLGKAAPGKPVMWRFLDLSEWVAFWTGYGFSFIFDSIEYFVGRSFAILGRIVRPWTWFRRSKAKKNQNAAYRHY